MRRARIRTTHDAPETAALVAGAVEPDNTDSMTTRVDGDAVETTLGRETTGGLHSTVDDYVVNLTVAARVIDGAGDRSDPRTDGAGDRDGTDTPSVDARSDCDCSDGSEPTDDQTDDTTDTTDTDTHE